MTSVRRFQDKAFRWAQANKEKARAILSAPPAKSTNSTLRNLDDYLKERDWKIDDDQEHGVALLSHVLSAPLTIRYCAENSSKPVASNQKWCFLGARAETTLPPDYWRECLMSAADQSWSIDFVGPDIRTGTPPVQLLHERSQLALRFDHQGLFHDLKDETTKQWNQFILLNPGLGHLHLKDNWLPTLEKLQGRALWLSAHSELDAERDSGILKNVLGLEVVYKPNPFCSRIIYEDPFDKQHFVSPNKFIALVEAEA